MRGTLKFILAFAIALVAMLAVRGLALTVYSVQGTGLQPAYVEGDRLLVNRWSYGLRTGDDQLFGYGRLLRRPVRRGDVVAFDDPADTARRRVLICRCTAVPGDTVMMGGVPTAVPGRLTCADQDYYWMEPVGDSADRNGESSASFGFVPERCIIGRVCCVLYSLIPAADAAYVWWAPFNATRFFVSE